MAKIFKQIITHCKDCPHKMSSPYPTSDSWERAEYWWCKNQENDIVPCDIEESEKHRQYLLKLTPEKNIRLIAGYVEWRDEKNITPPGWCKLDNE